MDRLMNFFGITDATDRARSLVKIMFVMVTVVSITIQLSTTFFLINMAEAVGGGVYIAGMTIIGLLIVVQMVVQVVLDYPTGAIGDWIGQRYIIASAFLSFAGAFALISLIHVAPIVVATLIYVLMGIGESQLSGASSAWFDNNYRVAMPNDRDRRQYGVCIGKVNMFASLFGTVALIPGSVLAVLFGRVAVFQLQAVLCVLIAIASLRFVVDFPEARTQIQQRPLMKDYRRLLHDGVSYLFSNRYLKYAFIGSTIAASVGIVWGQLLLFPMYFSYLGSEVPVSAYRTILFLISVITAERASALSKNLDAQKWVVRAALLGGGGFVFYMAFALIMYLLPPTPNSSVILIVPILEIEIGRVYSSTVLPILLILATFTLSSIFGNLHGILFQRLIVDVIPNRIRNSIYSLSPTMTTVIAIPQIAFFGWLIPNMGFPLTMAICGLISLTGVFIMYMGLTSPRPLLSEEGMATEKESSSEVVSADIPSPG